MKLLLIGLNSRYTHVSLAVYSIKEYLKLKGIESEICEYTINDPYEDIFFDIVEKSPDIIGFSTYIWNINLACRLADDIKKALKHVKIIFGGPEAGYSGKTYAGVDKIITGEGESQMYEYLTGKTDTADFKDFPFSYEKVPDTGKTVYYESSRGCPYRCSYCISSLEKELRFKDFDTVKKDLTFFFENNVKKVKFIDRTFNIRKDAYEILKFIIENSRATDFHFEIKPELFSEKDFELLKKARKDLFRFEVGIQSLNEKTLGAINRKNDTELIFKNLGRIINETQVTVHADLIAGLPYENLESFKNGFNKVYALKPHVLQLGFLKVLHGTQIEKDAQKYGIVYSSYPPYQFIKTDFLSVSDTSELKIAENGLEVFSNKGFFPSSLDFLFESNDILPYGFFLMCGNALKNKPPMSHPTLFKLFFWLYKENGFNRVEEFSRLLTADFKLKNPTKSLILT